MDLRAASSYLFSKKSRALQQLHRTPPKYQCVRLLNNNECTIIHWHYSSPSSSYLSLFQKCCVCIRRILDPYNECHHHDTQIFVVNFEGALHRATPPAHPTKRRRAAYHTFSSIHSKCFEKKNTNKYRAHIRQLFSTLPARINWDKSTANDFGIEKN